MRMKANKLLAFLLALSIVLSLGVTTTSLAVSSSIGGTPYRSDGTYDVSVPHTIFVNFNGDAKTQRGFTWYTDFDNLATKVMIATKADFSDARTVTGDASVAVQGGDRNNPAPPGTTDQAILRTYNYNLTQYMHKALVTGLSAGIKYYYKVGDGSSWSSVGSFTTQAAGATDFSFIDVADTQGANNNADYSSCWKPLLSQAFSTVPDASFVMDNGDLTNQGGDLIQWQNMADSAAANLMNTTFVPVAGNHESYTANAEDNPAGAFNLASGYNETGSYQNSFINHFNLALPSGETNTNKGAYYSFDYANAHFMILNTNYLNNDGTLSKEQIDWLKSECASSHAQWKIAAFHRAIYSVGTHIADEDVVALRAQLPTIMAQCGIDLVMQGHDHTYVRTKPVGISGPVNGTSTITENYKGVNTTFAVNPQGTIFIIPGAANDKFYVNSYNPSASGSSTAKLDVASRNLLPAMDKYSPTVAGAQLNQIDVKTTADLSDPAKNRKYNAPTFAGVKISGDRLVLTCYQYNIDNNTLAAIDTYGIYKPSTAPAGTPTSSDTPTSTTTPIATPTVTPTPTPVPTAAPTPAPKPAAAPKPTVTPAPKPVVTPMLTAAVAADVQKTLNAATSVNDLAARVDNMFQSLSKAKIDVSKNASQIEQIVNAAIADLNTVKATGTTFTAAQRKSFNTSVINAVKAEQQIVSKLKAHNLESTKIQAAVTLIIPSKNGTASFKLTSSDITTLKKNKIDTLIVSAGGITTKIAVDSISGNSKGITITGSTGKGKNAKMELKVTK